MTRLPRTSCTILRTLILVAVLAVGACGDDGGSTVEGSDDTSETTEAAPGDTTATTDAAPAATDKVDIRGSAFIPDAVSVKVGAQVTWTNSDTAVHSVVADDDSFESDDLGKGDTFERTFDKAGTFAYKCGIHSFMTGSVVVA